MRHIKCVAFNRPSVNNSCYPYESMQLHHSISIQKMLLECYQPLPQRASNKNVRDTINNCCSRHSVLILRSLELGEHSMDRDNQKGEGGEERACFLALAPCRERICPCYSLQSSSNLLLILNLPPIRESSRSCFWVEFRSHICLELWSDCVPFLCPGSFGEQ